MSIDIHSFLFFDVLSNTFSFMPFSLLPLFLHPFSSRLFTNFLCFSEFWCALWVSKLSSFLPTLRSQKLVYFWLLLTVSLLLLFLLELLHLSYAQSVLFFIFIKRITFCLPQITFFFICVEIVPFSLIHYSICEKYQEVGLAENFSALPLCSEISFKR